MHKIHTNYLNVILVNDALDDILADSDDESEEQAVIDKVLDEIGIELSGKVIIVCILNMLRVTTRVSSEFLLNIHFFALKFQLADAPSAHQGTIRDKSKAKSKAADEDKEIEAMLAQLKG